MAYHKAAGADKTPPPPKWPDSDPPIPPGMDLDKNIQEAEAHKGNLLWFYNQVQSGRPWDYKNVKGLEKTARIEDFGNFNYGATGAALGLPDGVLIFGAGGKQVLDHRNEPEKHTNIFGIHYGDDPRDSAMVRRGIEYYRRVKSGRI